MRRALLVLLLLLLPAVPEAAALPGAGISATDTVPAAQYPGRQRLHYEYGPVQINPGQNTIELGLNDLKPEVPGYITRFSPGLVYADSGKTPRVDVVHLHHGVWLIDGAPTFAAGEEKTIFNMPQGFGVRHEPGDQWVLNHMIHNLTPTPTSVYVTYDIDFVPDSEPAAGGITPVKPLWMDVAGLKPYPVFDAVRGQGRKGRYVFPRDAGTTQQEKVGPAQQWTADRDVTLVATAGHLHPGGLHTDLRSTRTDRTQALFRSQAKYFEPAGAVSWDVAMTATDPDWRVAVRAGDRLETDVTYDVRKASWYESMGIMVVFYAEGILPGAVDPFAGPVDTRGRVTHGHLRENDNHGGDPFGLPDARELIAGAPAAGVRITGFQYRRGDLGLTGRAGRPPVVRAGSSMRFTNLDAVEGQAPAESAYHTVTACRAPCNRSTGIAYPLADAPPGQQFDSGELGFGPPGLTAAAQRNVWRTPDDLDRGTYTYFCRVHPFMRGAFRVKGGKR